MNKEIITILGIISFIPVLMILLKTFAKSDEKIANWSPFIIILFIVILISWWVSDLSLQWVLIEATTLFGAILISLSKTEKSIEVGWKFLLINSFGLGLAFMGIIFISFGTKDDTSTSLELAGLFPKISTHQNLLVETGIWLAVFGYSAKLGLFPNHFWVSDTYAESPSQISSILSAFLPVSVVLAINPFLILETQFTVFHFSTVTALMILGLITMVYSLLTVHQTDDIRRITALTALFHSGGLAVFISLYPGDELIFYALAANITIKSLLFTSMGILRMDLGSRALTGIESTRGLNHSSIYLHLFTLGMTFVIPFSPFFIADLYVLKIGLQNGKHWVVLIPILNLAFFLVLLHKFLPLIGLKDRDYLLESRTILVTRFKITILMAIISSALGFYGIYMFITGGF